MVFKDILYSAGRRDLYKVLSSLHKKDLDPTQQIKGPLGTESGYQSIHGIHMNSFIIQVQILLHPPSTSTSSITSKLIMT